MRYFNLNNYQNLCVLPLESSFVIVHKMHVVFLHVYIARKETVANKEITGHLRLGILNGVSLGFQGYLKRARGGACKP